MDRKLKIGICSDAILPTVDGISNCVDNYAALINKNHGQATMLTPYNPNQKDYKHKYPVYNYKSWAFFVHEQYRIGWPFKECYRQEVRRMNFDLLHSHCPLASSYLCKLVVEEQKLPVVLTYHTKYEIELDKRVPTKKFRKFAQNFILNNINRADEVWVPSEGSVKSLRKIGYTGNYIVMPNGVDMPKGKAPKEDIDIVMKKHSLSNDVPILLFVGRTMWYKNIKIIFDSLKIIKKNGFKFKLLMVGHGKEFNSIRRYCKKIGLKDDVIFTNEIKDRKLLRAYYSAADLFLFPSTFDTNGLVVREAAASLCPSILTRGSCAAEGLEDDVTAIFCDENAEDMADKIQSVINDKATLERIGKNAFDSIYISWDDAVKMAYDRYEKICENWDYEN